VLAACLADIDRRIASMFSLRDGLKHLYEIGATLPRDDMAFERCVCSLIKAYIANSNQEHSPGEGA
jgi:hypothetical protein